MALQYPWKLMAASPQTSVAADGVPPMVPLTRWFQTRQACIDACVSLFLGETETPPYDATYPSGYYRVLAEGVCSSAWGAVITNTDIGVPDSEAGELFLATADNLYGPPARCVNATLSTVIVSVYGQLSLSGTRNGCVIEDPAQPCAFIPGYPPSEYQISESNRMSSLASDFQLSQPYTTYVFQRLPYA